MSSAFEQTHIAISRARTGSNMRLQAGRFGTEIALHLRTYERREFIMTRKLLSKTSRALLAAGLLLGVAAAQAAGGYFITNSQEATITVGMSADEVQAAVGSPAQQIKFGDEAGPTWIYHLNQSEDTVLDVDFGADGKVASVSERERERP